VFLLIPTFFLLASAIVANKLALTVLSPITLVAIRMIFGGAILLWYERAAIKNIKPFLGTLSLIAFCTTFVNSLLKAYALQHLPSNKAALIAGLDPIITSLIAFVILQERLNIRQYIGIAIAIAGSIILTQDGISGWKLAGVLPALAAFAAIAIGRYGWVLAQKLLIGAHLTPSQLNAGTMTISGVIAFAYLSTDIPFFLGQLSNLNTSGLIGAVLYTTLIGNVLAYSLYASLLKRYSATLLSLFGFLIPIFVTLLAIPILSETCPATTLIAGAIMFTGVALFIKSSK
jgi:drug/metabolite transporter (DMT)-like permease